MNILSTPIIAYPYTGGYRTSAQYASWILTSYNETDLAMLVLEVKLESNIIPLVFHSHCLRIPNTGPALLLDEQDLVLRLVWTNPETIFCR